MNFFEHQDRAKRNTRYLFLLLGLAVFCLVSLTTFFLAALVYLGTEPEEMEESTIQGIAQAFSLEVFFWVAVVVCSVVLLGGLFRFVRLLGGGRRIAESVGGHLLQRNTTNADEKKILNVVEEMAIASGTAVPPVYLIEDDAINAFAAGYSPRDAIIGVTRGCIQQLSRDELQGVVAHEFSHIFHGDMRINMRLISLLYGILVIGLIGELIMRLVVSGNHDTRKSNSKDDNSAALYLLLFGLGLFILGYTGTFFGKLIKAAVSRQREFLADASAVQFTRNPDGIAGALKKIGMNAHGSKLQNPQAAEFSHMYFGQGVSSFLSMMATHPPLEQRIKRITPQWDGTFTDAGTKKGQKKSAHKNQQKSSVDEALVSGFASTAMDIDTTIELIAQPHEADILSARNRLAEIPPHLKEATGDVFDARGILFGLLLDSKKEWRTAQLDILQTQLPAEHFTELLPIIEDASNVGNEQRLPLVELCLPTLKQLSKDQHQEFLAILKLLIDADKKVSLMEWALLRIVIHNLDKPIQPSRNYNLHNLKLECRILLSLIAYAGNSNDEMAQAAFSRACDELKLQLPMFPKKGLKLTDADWALEQLNNLKPLQKPLLLKAMHQCMLQDNQITTAEAELFRAIADSLDCPIPPFISQPT